MATAINFEGSNAVMKAPPSHEETISDLPVYSNGQCCVSCWQLTPQELIEIIVTGQIYLSVFYGKSQPPVFLGSESEVRSVVQDYGGVWRKA